MLFIITGCLTGEKEDQPVYTAEFLELCSEEELLNLYESEDEELGIEKDGKIYYPSTLEDKKILSIIEDVAWIKGGAKVIITKPIQNSRRKKEIDEEFIEKAVEVINKKVTEVTVTISEDETMEIDYDNAGHTHMVRGIKIEREKQEQ